MNKINNIELKNNKNTLTTLQSVFTFAVFSRTELIFGSLFLKINKQNIKHVGNANGVYKKSNFSLRFLINVDEFVHRLINVLNEETYRKYKRIPSIGR